jgi:hypothetical protein
VLTLPSWATLTRKELDYIVECMAEFYGLKQH